MNTKKHEIQRKGENNEWKRKKGNPRRNTNKGDIKIRIKEDE